MTGAIKLYQFCSLLTLITVTSSAPIQFADHMERAAKVAKLKDINGDGGLTKTAGRKVKFTPKMKPKVTMDLTSPKEKNNYKPKSVTHITGPQIKIENKNKKRPNHVKLSAGEPQSRTGIQLEKQAAMDGYLEAGLVNCQVEVNFDGKKLQHDFRTTPNCCIKISKQAHFQNNLDDLCLPLSSEENPCWTDVGPKTLFLMDLQLIEQASQGFLSQLKNQEKNSGKEEFPKTDATNVNMLDRRAARPLVHKKSLKELLQEKCPSKPGIHTFFGKDPKPINADILIPDVIPQLKTSDNYNFVVVAQPHQLGESGDYYLIDTISKMASEDPSSWKMLYRNYKELIESMRKKRLQEVETKRIAIVFAIAQCVICASVAFFLAMADIRKSLGTWLGHVDDCIWNLIDLIDDDKVHMNKDRTFLASGSGHESAINLLKARLASKNKPPKMEKDQEPTKFSRLKFDLLDDKKVLNMRKNTRHLNRFIRQDVDALLFGGQSVIM